jgi:amino acid adenylation domain-containing protein
VSGVRRISSLTAAFAVQARRFPDRLALCCESGESWSYGALAQHAEMLAGTLERLGVGQESRVALLGGRTADTVVAILGVLSAGAAYCMIDHKWPIARRRQVLDSVAPAAAIIADADLAVPDGLSCPVIRPGSGAMPRLAAYSPRPIPESALAYVLFTSGSTGRPKGVMVEHKSVINMLASLDALAPIAAGFAGAWIAPPAFDVSVWEIFSALTAGGTLHIPGEDRLSGGDELWHYLCEARIENAYVPPGLIAPLAAAAERRRGMLRRLLVGVEPIPQGVLSRLGRACPGLRIVNGYGPTETTITATLLRFEKATDPHRRVPIGRAVAGSRVEILGGDLAPVPPGVSGEIVVFGDCLARGYLNDSNGGFVTIRGERAYRTGDFGRLLADGAIEFIGRDDGQLKISGFRVEIGEIEAALTAIAGVRRAIVITTGETEARRLIAAVEAPDCVTAKEVRAHLAALLPSYAVPSRILVMRAFPQSANGKIDVARLLAAGRERSAQARAYVAPQNAWQQEVAETWSRVLEIADIGIDDNFYELGGSSLDAVRIAAQLGARGRPALASAILAAGTIRLLAEPAVSASPIPVVAPGSYPATKAQEGLWAWRELNLDSPNTTVVYAIKLDGPIDQARMARALRAVVARHESLRTTFDFHAGYGLQQHVAPSFECDLSAIEIVETAIDAEILRWLEHRFDVRIRTWAARLLIGDRFGALVFAADHLVFDGESAQILQRDLATAYDDPTALSTAVPGPASLGSLLAPAPRRAEELRAWWRDTLAEFADRPMLPEPLTRRSPDLGLERLRTRIDGEVWNAIGTTARQAATTPFIVVLAALKSFLRQRDGEADSTVSIAMSNRHRIGSADAIGHFVNLVPIRDRLAGSDADALRFSDYLKRTAQLFAAAIDHGDFPLEAMIADLVRPSAAGIAGPTRIVLVQQAATEAVVTRSGLRFAAWANQTSNAIYDLALFITEPQGSVPAQFEWVWTSGAVLETSIGWLAEAFAGFLHAAVSAPERMLSALPALSTKETALVFATATPASSAPSGESETLGSLFEAQVARRPDSVAIEDGATLITYAQLARRAAAIAGAFGDHAQVDAVIIVLDKSADQLAAMLAALSVGAPYLPLAPDHARTRLPDLAIRSGARLCVSDSRHAAAIKLPDSCRVVLVDTLDPIEAELLPPAKRAKIDAADLAYIMPTSGSTGPPKLVGVPHRAVVRLVYRNQAIPLDETDVTMLVANSSFDAATLEIWGALANGGRVVVPSEETLRDPTLLCAAIQRHGVSCGFFTTTFFEQMLGFAGRLAGMKHVIVGGEAVPPRVFAAAARAIPRSALVNGYGPTENTTFSCCFRLDREPGALRSVPIGAPISGSGAIVVDAALRPLAPGMPGEILVTGAGLARGYIDDPELTAQRFIGVPALGGARAYRTGDLGRLLPEGILEYLGRLDRQLKIRGFRVEPGEVEATLSMHPAVRRSVAYADDLGGGRALMAAVEAAGIDETGLRAWLVDRLPAFAVPTRIHIVDRLPITANGKLDLAALSAAMRVSSREESAPRTELEGLIADIAAQLLGVLQISPDDDLFELGANSMVVLSLAGRLSDHLGLPVPSHWIYDARTVRSLAHRIKTRAASSQSDAPQRILDRAARIRKSSSADDRQPPDRPTCFKPASGPARRTGPPSR